MMNCAVKMATTQSNGGVGNDSLYGGSNDDKLFGEAGIDLMFGNDGHDEMRVATRTTSW